MTNDNSVELIWNNGRELEVKNVHKNFRGPEMPILAKKIAINHKINAHTLAVAEKRLKKAIEEQETYQNKNQQLKYLWHILVKY